MSNIHQIGEYIESNLTENVNNYEHKVTNAADDTRAATQARIRRIQEASQQARAKIDQFKDQAIGRIKNISSSQQEQIVEVLNQSTDTLDGLIGEVLGTVVNMIHQLLTNIGYTIRNLFQAARKVLNGIFVSGLNFGLDIGVRRSVITGEPELSMAADLEVIKLEQTNQDGDYMSIGVNANTGVRADNEGVEMNVLGFGLNLGHGGRVGINTPFFSFGTKK